MRLLLLFCLAPALCTAGTWTGNLVDSKCYQTMEQNHSPSDTETNVDRDRDIEIRYCHPKVKTKAFAIVDFNGQSFLLDSAGNAKAAELVRSAPKGTKKFYVTLMGEMSHNTVKVDSIARTP
jgi:hypothetical protein